MRERESTVLSHLFQELTGIHELAGSVCDVSAAQLPTTVVLQVLVLYVVPSTNHKHIGL